MYINFKGIGFNGVNGLALDDHSNHINIEHCYFTRFAVRLWTVRTGSYDIRISSTGFYGGGSAIALEDGTQEIEVQNNIFNQNSGIAAKLFEECHYRQGINLINAKAAFAFNPQGIWL